MSSSKHPQHMVAGWLVTMQQLIVLSNQLDRTKHTLRIPNSRKCCSVAVAGNSTPVKVITCLLL